MLGQYFGLIDMKFGEKIDINLDYKINPDAIKMLRGISQKHGPPKPGWIILHQLSDGTFIQDYLPIKLPINKDNEKP